MNTNIIYLTLTALILSSCLSQSPAPIDYGSSGTYSRSTISQSSDQIVEKPIIHETTTWGDQKISEDVIATPQNAENVLPNDTGLSRKAPLRTETISHEVIEGETIDSIARQYDISRDELIKANKLKAPYQLDELQIIKIPPQLAQEELKEQSYLDSAQPNPKSNLKVENTTALTHKSQNSSLINTSILAISGNIISKFGDINSNSGTKNNGINISAPLGTDVYSSDSGSVVFAGNDQKFGNLIIIKSDNQDIFMAYSHMSDLILKKGDIVSSGQLIGHVGETGNVTSPQLHFAVRQGKTPIDPSKYLHNH